MKKSFQKWLVGATLALSTFTLCAQSEKSQFDDAILRVYAEELQENPQNYNVYFRRSQTLYSLNNYSQALADIEKCIEYTPSSNTDLLSQAYALQGNIYLMLDKPQEALEPITKALSFEPKSYTLLYQKANIEYEIGQYKEAREDFKKLQRIHNRSLESLIGLARVAVKEGNLGLANEYADQAVALYPSEGETYLRRASVRTLLGNNTGAVDDMLMALSLNPANTKAITRMVAMSAVDYGAVISALSGAIAQAPSKGIFYYIRAMIAQGHYHYPSAIDDYNTILSRNLDNYHGIHAALAECYLALMDYTKALDEINYAIASTPDNAAYYLVNSRIHFAKGEYEVALRSVGKTLDRYPDNSEAMLWKALSLIALNRFDEASATLGEAIITDPDNPRPYIVRGWLLAEKMGKPADGAIFLRRCSELGEENVFGSAESSASAEALTLKGFALLLLGDTDNARQWADSLVAPGVSDEDGRLHYLAACLYSQTGDLPQAFQAMETSLSKGYSNLRQWKAGDFPAINVAPLRSEATFDTLLTRYSYIFGK